MRVIFHTDAGDITVGLLPDKAPVAVANFVDLATGAMDYAPQENGRGTDSGPFYDDTWFHYVVADFVIQGGDPTGTTRGGLTHTFLDEIHDVTFDRPGVLACLGQSEYSHGSQFLITLNPAPHLDGFYTVFGLIEDAESLAVARQISRGRAYEMRPVRPVFIKSVEIVE